MSDFFVHWNTVTKHIRIHLGTCGACKNGRGMHEGRIAAGRGRTYDWVAAKTYREAKDIVSLLKSRKPVLKKSKVKLDCGLCHPARAR